MGASSLPPVIILRLLPPLSSLPTGDVRLRGSPRPRSLPQGRRKAPGEAAATRVGKEGDQSRVPSCCTQPGARRAARGTECAGCKAGRKQQGWAGNQGPKMSHGKQGPLSGSRRRNSARQKPGSATQQLALLLSVLGSAMATPCWKLLSCQALRNKTFISWCGLSGGTTRGCQEKPGSSRCSILCPVHPNAPQPVAGAGAWCRAPRSSSLPFSAFFPIYGDFQHVQGREGGREGHEGIHNRPKRRDRVCLFCGREQEPGRKRHFLWQCCLRAGSSA